MISIKSLEKMNACKDGIEWYKKNRKKTFVETLKGVKENHILNYFNWFISKKLKHMDLIRYAIYAAEQVINIYEKYKPNDDRPRNAIEAAKKYLKLKTRAAGDAARAAGDAAGAAGDAAGDAAWAAWAAGDAARAAGAAWAAWAAAGAAAWAAAGAAAWAAAGAAAWAAASNNMKLKIVKYGLKLLSKMGII